MLGKKMTSKQTFESLKMDKYILDNKQVELIKNNRIYITSLEIQNGNAEPVQLFREHQIQNNRDIGKLCSDFERLNNIEKTNQ